RLVHAPWHEAPQAHQRRGAGPVPARVRRRRTQRRRDRPREGVMSKRQRIAQLEADLAELARHLGEAERRAAEATAESEARRCALADAEATNRQHEARIAELTASRSEKCDEIIRMGEHHAQLDADWQRRYDQSNAAWQKRYDADMA